MQETETVAAPRTYWVPEREDITIYGILAALSDPTRLGIVRAIAERDECCPLDRKSTRLNSSHTSVSRMPSSA